MTLLSLSVYVDEVRTLRVRAASPALVFRLPDFPTVLVRPADDRALSAAHACQHNCARLRHADLARALASPQYQKRTVAGPETEPRPGRALQGRRRRR